MQPKDNGPCIRKNCHLAKLMKKANAVEHSKPDVEVFSKYRKTKISAFQRERGGGNNPHLRTVNRHRYSYRSDKNSEI